MSLSIIAIPLMLLFVAIIIAIPVIIGVYVYRDAKSRGMDAVLWTLITIIAPGLLGLIIYLIVRRDHIVLNCPSCNAEVQENFATCPACGQKLKASCSNCGTSLNPEWRICPQCGTEITDTAEFTPPVINKGKGNKGLVALIAAIIVVLVLFVVIIAIPFIALRYNSSVSYTSSYTSENLDDVIEELAPETFSAMSVEEAKLDESYIKLINEKKSQGAGIYSITCDAEESGASLPANGSEEDAVNYELTYKYMILVINPADGKSYNFNGISFNTDGDRFPHDPTLKLNEVNASEVDEFNNVFVVKMLTEYNLNFKNISEGSTADNLSLIVNISGDTANNKYEIPTDSDEYSVALSQEIESTAK